MHLLASPQAPSILASPEVPVQALKKSLGQNGWAIFDFPNKFRMRKDMEVLAALLGRPVAGRGTEAIEVLQPTKKVAAHASSLSRQHGYGTFPLHCDTAHWLTPCRYILLGCIDPSIFSTPTLLLDFAEIELTRAEMASLRVETFLIKNGRRSFYGTICCRATIWVRERIASGRNVPERLFVASS